MKRGSRLKGGGGVLHNGALVVALLYMSLLRAPSSCGAVCAPPLLSPACIHALAHAPASADRFTASRPTST